ncbi:MAG: hypothetical protein RL385_1051, partial [Pseudomonadota bacterium]
CVDALCAVPACDDEVENGTETGVDCGGSCTKACADGIPSCEAGTASCGPTAAFSLSAGGPAPITVTATSMAAPGSAAIEQTIYDWGDGTSRGPETAHEYTAAGTFTVTQTVTDAEGRSTLVSHEVTITGFAPVRMSTQATDQSVGESQQGVPVRNVAISDDGTTIEVLGMDVGQVRSDSTVAPGSGVWYFEGQRLVEDTEGPWGFGVATEDRALTDISAFSESASSFGVTTQGEITGRTINPCAFPAIAAEAAGWRIPGEINPNVGYVVDYRAATPVIFIIGIGYDSEVPRVFCKAPLTAVTKPLYILFKGMRAVVGPAARVNTGADTVNRPFHFTPEQVRAALGQPGVPGGAEVAAAVRFGFGRTRPTELPRSAAPQIVAPADRTAQAGTAVTLAATASDPDEGNVTEKIEWAVRSTAYSHPILGSGGTFTFTPATVGKHLVKLQVTDRVGVRTEVTTTITATAAAGGVVLPRAEVRLVEEATTTALGQRAHVTANGLGVYGDATGYFKDGVRANQALYGDFWYFEADRNPGRAPNMGVGLVVGNESLNPYSIYEVPWSMSFNLSAGIWKNLINIGNIREGLSNVSSENDAGAMYTNYGFAVDYTGEHPIVHVIVGVPQPRVLQTVVMNEATVPVHPMVYSSEGEDGTETMPAVRVNFGATPFTFNPAAVLAAAGVSTAGLKPYWGN